MNNVAKKTTSILLAITMFLSVFSFMVIASATESEAASYPKNYPNTYQNTGSGAMDIIGVARTQIGYQENSVGTKYGAWYYPSFVNQPWCAMFVSWCANQAGIPETVIPRFAACSVGVAWFKTMGRWHDSKYYGGGKYTPQKGDVIFYRDSGYDGVSTHVGLVAGLNGNYIVAIEGNATDSSVCEFTTSSSRSLDSSYVIGYGSPNYSNELGDEPDTYEVWQVTADALNVRAEYSTSSKSVTTVNYGTTLNVTKFKKSEGYLWGYTKANGKNGWCALDFCEYIYGNINGVYYQMPPKVTTKTVELFVGEKKKISGTNTLGATYTSSDETIAKVSSKGKITAVAEGTATIKLKTKTGSAKCTVTVKNPYLSQTEGTVCVGDKFKLTVTGAQGDIVWASEDKTIAKAGATGNVKGVSPGTVNITATVSGVTLTCAVVVTEFPTLYENFTVAKDKTHLKDTYEEPRKSLVLVPKDTAIKVDDIVYSDTYTWGHTAYGSYSGWLVLNKCKYVNGTIGGKKLTYRPYTTIKENKIYVTDSFDLKVYSTSKKVTYTSSDENIAAVDENGKILGVSKGTAVITAKAGSYTFECNVKVKNPTISAKTIELTKDETAQLTVKGGVDETVWTSADESIASVNEEGTVTATGYGTTTVTAERGGVKLKCQVTVPAPYLSATSKSLYVGKSKTLKVIGSGNSEIKWKSADKTIVKVNSSGKITGVKAGTTKVAAIVDGLKLKCTVKAVAQTQ